VRRAVLALPLAAAAAVLAAASGCRRDPAAAWRGMNVVWISFDSVRADHCSFEGYARKTTPLLDTVAARGVRFPRTVAQAPYTLPSYASMLTSRYVSELAVREQRDEKDPSKVLGAAPSPAADDVLVSEALKAGGYKTAAFVQSWVSAPLGFEQGWDLFRHEQETLATKIPSVVAWIEANKASRFFAFVYSTDTHYPFGHAHGRHGLYDPPPSSFEFDLDTITGVREGRIQPSKDDIAKSIADYDEGIHATDADLAPLFDYLKKSGLWEKTILVFNSDHGEEFDEHGVISHGQTYYDGVVRTPLVISPPGGPAAGAASRDLVQNIDVAPTIAEMVGVPRPAAWSGRSLVPELSRRSEANPRGIERREPQESAPQASGPQDTARRAYTEGAWTFWIGSVTTEDRKLILVTPQERMLFDLSKDPGETANLATSDPDGVRMLYHALMKHLGGPGQWLASGAGAGKPPSYETWMKQVMGHYGLNDESDVVKELRSLGYLH
jgi:arylsulfatase A-like enzyme